MKPRMAMFRSVLALVTFSIASVANAGLLTLDFDRPSPGETFVADNYFEDGFRFSPNYHYDRGAFVEAGFENSPWMGWDSSGCGTHYNPNFLGPEQYDGPCGGEEDVPAVLWMDYDLAPFTLHSIWSALPRWEVHSSRGGFFSSGFAHSEFVPEFAGPEWTEVEWLLFVLPADPGAPFGVDQITVNVPEPNAAALLALALALVAIALRSACSRRGFA
jgi:hypothetical protein